MANTKRQIIEGTLIDNVVVFEHSDKANEFYNKSRYGNIIKKRLEISMLEAFYLIENEKIIVKNKAGRKITNELFLKKASRKEKEFLTRYKVFSNLRDRGYITKTALKFGAEFRVYDRGVKPGEDHAKWVVYPVHERDKFTWYEFAAKNRVAHSTKKKLLIGIVDDEGDVTYYEIKWIRP